MTVDVTIERRDGVLVLSVSGRLEAVSAPAFLETVKAEIDAGDRAVIMDLERLDYLGSAGLRVVFIAASELRKRDAGFALCSPPPPIAKVIRLSGVEELIPVHSSRADAFAAL